MENRSVIVLILSNMWHNSFWESASKRAY